MANSSLSTIPDLPMLHLTNVSQPMPLDEDDAGPYILLAVAMTLTMVTAFIGNILVILVILHTRKLHTITSGFLLNLAISDLSTGLFLLPFMIGGALYHEWIFQNTAFCQFLGFVYALLCFISTWTLASISVERYIAISNPLHYHSIVTKTRAWVVIISTWVLAFTVGIIPFYQRRAYVYQDHYGFCLLDYENYQLTAILLPSIEICIPFSLMCFTYTSIGRVACTQARKKIIQCNEAHCIFVSPKKKDYRAAKILALMAGVFTFCWLPFTILSLIQAIKPPGTYPVYVTLLSLWLTLLSSAINPWLYSILNRTFRDAMHKSALPFLQKVTCGRLGNSNMQFIDDTTRLRNNSQSQDNVICKNAGKRVTDSRQIDLNRREAIKLQTIKEVSKSTEISQLPGRVESTAQDI